MRKSSSRIPLSFDKNRIKICVVAFEFIMERKTDTAGDLVYTIFTCTCTCRGSRIVLGSRGILHLRKHLGKM